MKYEIGTDPRTGRRVTQYRSFKGSKREAKAELVRLMDTVRCGEHVDPAKLILAEYLDRWEQGWPRYRSDRRRASATLSFCGFMFALT